MYGRQAPYRLSYILSDIHIRIQVNACAEHVNVEAQRTHCLPPWFSALLTGATASLPKVGAHRFPLV